jgi:hypothetical protein
MADGSVEETAVEDVYTLLGVRRDGVASVVDLVATGQLHVARARAQALLRDHISCVRVEMWRDGALIEQFARA